MLYAVVNAAVLPFYRQRVMKTFTVFSETYVSSFRVLLLGKKTTLFTLLLPVISSSAPSASTSTSVRNVLKSVKLH